MHKRRLSGGDPGPQRRPAQPGGVKRSTDSGLDEAGEEGEAAGIGERVQVGPARALDAGQD
jgi:hypothetical protein